jgi:hypothetical protein
VSDFIKRLAYEKVEIRTIGGVLKISVAPGGCSVAFDPHSDRPVCGYGKDTEEAAKTLVNDLRRMANGVEEDLKAFMERNK